MTDRQPSTSRTRSRRLSSRIRDLSSRRVASGGEQGWTRWLLPALVVAVVVLAAAGVRDAYRDADAALA